MPADRRATLPEVFGVVARRYVHLIGGGGKTSLLFALAASLAREGRTVVTTTTTRIFEPAPAESDRVLLGTEAQDLGERLRGEFATRRHVTVAASRYEGERKLIGLPVAVLDALVLARVADHVIVEADGAAGRSLKAHRDHEPVVSPRSDLVIAVVGVDCVGAPIDDAHVHRAALLGERLGRPPGAAVTPDDVAAAVLHPAGYLAGLAEGCEIVAFINKAANPPSLADARRVGEALRRMDRSRRVGRVVLGDVRLLAFESM